MNKNYIYQITMYESMLAQIYVFLVLYIIFAFYHEKKISKNAHKPEKCKLGQNTFIHCSRLTVVHVYLNVFL